MKEYKGLYYDPNSQQEDGDQGSIIDNIHNEFSKLVLEFE